MPLGKVVGLGPGHIVLNRDPVGTQPDTAAPPTFGPCLLWPNSRPSQEIPEPWSMLRRKALAEFLLSVIELLFKARAMLALQALY